MNMFAKIKNRTKDRRTNVVDFKQVALLASSLLTLQRFQLTLLIGLLTLTGFVCTNKAHPGEECQSNSNVLCFECDSRTDANCADPFDFSPSATIDTPASMNQVHSDGTTINENQLDITNNTNRQLAGRQRQLKKLPPAIICHGCCVKITSRMSDGGIYVKRTCTTNLQINYFMVGLVCMKESGDRGKMCFCESDYCNGQTSRLRQGSQTLWSIMTAMTLIMLRFV